jgi:pimeloyl-ACP methyl ester carboxylesterase
MPVDEALLERHWGFSSPELGISEYSVSLRVGGGWTVGVLSRPLGHEQENGWVIAHSFGPEQMELQMTEVFLARRVAAAGYPVLRFHCQGYGDSEDLDMSLNPSSHVRDTVDAVAAMRAQVGANVGLIGARFGAMVSAIVAERLGLSQLILIDPVVSGRRFANEILRARRITAVAGDGSIIPRSAIDPSTEADTVSVNGFLMTAEMQRELRALELASCLSDFRGRSLVVQVTVKDRMQPALADLVDRLNRLGADAALRVVTDPFAPRFGREHLQVIGPDSSGDLLSDLNRALARELLGWLEGSENRGPHDGR